MVTTGGEGWDDEGPDDEEWVDEDAGPLVRSYTITGGRTGGVKYDLSALVAVRPGADPSSPALRLGPEHLRILELCADRPLALAELSGILEWPLSAIRVLVGDLSDRRLVIVTDAAALAARQTGAWGWFSRPTLEKLLDGLSRL